MLELNFNPFPTLTSERLTLRQLRETDKQEMFDIRSNPALMHFVPRPLAEKVEDAITLITTVNEGIAKNELINFAITISGEDKLIGMVGYHRVQKEHYRAEIGYMLHGDYHGKKIMEEAVNCAVGYGFDVMKLHSIEAVISPENIPSLKLIEKCGFVKEAHFREKEFVKGEFRDLTVYSKLTDVK
ncbi:MAG: GNAT family N-acetyltransferase [Bacteroidota bacterium]|nr:GNAT family N-acetyltransferase [Bacteroidota bacterium]